MIRSVRVAKVLLAFLLALTLATAMNARWQESDRLQHQTPVTSGE